MTKPSKAAMAAEPRERNPWRNRALASARKVAEKWATRVMWQEEPLAPDIWRVIYTLAERELALPGPGPVGLSPGALKPSGSPKVNPQWSSALGLGKLPL